MKDVYATRRMFVLWLPFTVLGMAVYIGSYAHSLTFNGLSLLGVTALADGPLIQGTWDGSFVDGLQATYDLAYLEVAATLVEDSSRVSFATITAKEGASASVVANQSGLWAMAVRAVSQAGKKSEFASAGTVEVKLVDLAGAIEAVQDSANGKNKVTYSSHAPTPDDPGIFDDTWFVGQVGRPNDVVEATNLARNSSFANLGAQMYGGTMYGTSNAVLSVSDAWSTSGSTSLKITPGTANTSTAEVILRGNPESSADAGKTFTISADFHLEEPQTGSLWADARKLIVRGAGNTNIARTDPAPNEAGTTRMSLTVTIPEGTTSWYLLLANGSSVTPAWWDLLDIAEISAPRPYFDGDTPSGTTDNESHYRWTGEPHASTSEKYLPALDIGDSDNWNVIEQYRHDGTGWVKVELSHYVFSTVDLGKATVGELDGIRIMARTITGDLFSGDAFDGIVFRGNTFVTRDGNGEFSDRGLFFQKPDGTAIFRVPTDGTPISMSAADVQIQRAQVDELELNEGRVRSGGLFELSSGVTPPPSPPEMSSAWDLSATLPRPNEQRMDWNGFAAWGDKWVRGVNVLGTGEGDRLEVYNADGTLNKTIPILIDPRHDLTVIGDICYVFGKDHVVTANDVYCFAYNLTTGARVARWQFLTSVPDQKIGVTSVGSDLLTAQVSASGNTLIVNRRNASTGLVIESSPTGLAGWDLNYTKDVQGIHWDGTDLYVTHQDSTRVYTYASSGYTRKAGASNGTQWAGWANPNRNAGGMVFVGSIPVVVSGGVYVGSAITSDSAVEACFTWYSEGYETTPSPASSALVSPRETFTVSLPARPGLSKRVYVRKGSSGSWARYDVDENQTALVQASVPGGMYPLPTVNSFPNADPAVFQSTNGNVVVRGDGSGKWGPLTFNADGTMSSSQVPEWVPVTTFKSGFGANSWGYAPAYRVWPDGKVEWRGIVAGTIGAGQTPLFTIPAAAMPAEYCQFGSATSYNSTYGSTARVEFRSAANPNDASAYDGAATRTWVSLDGLYYYLT